MLQQQQLGVAVPGGAEAACHARRALRTAILDNADLGVFAVIDLDLQNCYPSLDWKAVDEA
eukprot:5133996-Prorocentrum_lima.AAC.1